MSVTSVCNIVDGCLKEYIKIFYKLKRMNHNRCTLKYDSFDRLETLINIPFIDLQDCNDDKKKSCRKGEFLCPQENFCIPIELVCDGLNHCAYNEDENFCCKFWKICLYFFNINLQQNLQSISHFRIYLNVKIQQRDLH